MVRSEEPKALELKKKVEARRVLPLRGLSHYSAVLLLADALEKPPVPIAPRCCCARSLDLRGHVMRTADQVRHGQNQGAAPVKTQVIDKDIQ